MSTPKSITPAAPITRFLASHPPMTLAILATAATAFNSGSPISVPQLESYDQGTPAPRDRAVAISRATGGEVTIEELIFPGGVPYGARLTASATGSDPTIRS